MGQDASGSKYVTIVSEDGQSTADCRSGFRFIIPKQAAVLSNTLKDMLSKDIGMLEAESGVVKLMYSAPVVEKLCHYLLFRHHHITTPGGQSTSKGSAHNFDDQIPIELALQVCYLFDGLTTWSSFRLECADFLDIVSHYTLYILASGFISAFFRLSLADSGPLPICSSFSKTHPLDLKFLSEDCTGVSAMLIGFQSDEALAKPPKKERLVMDSRVKRKAARCRAPLGMKLPSAPINWAIEWK
ncbi:uncharacterized protein VP01_1639g8 [Puccinia sorghi]|uniref:Elongin-C n=1 Tax=Puccinia sorghi TaxID=27349 RepID=A0A0L6VGQ0_9BASI|nr:uncharacterized protein VP01_1639g8 [Puccinia sorghi]